METSRPCYEEMMTAQIEQAKAKKASDLDKLLKEMKWDDQLIKLPKL